VAWRVDPSTVGDHLADCLWPFLLAACAANLASAVLKAVTWRGLLDGVRGVDRRLRRLDLVSPLLVGALVNTGLPGRAGEVAKVVLARRRIARRGGAAGIAQVAGSIAAEHLVSTLAWGILAVGVVCALPVPGAVRVVAILAAAGCLALTALIARLPAPGRELGGWWRRPSRAVIDCWGAVQEGLRALRRPRACAAVSVAAVGQWAAQWVAIMLTLHATGLGGVGPAAAGLILVSITLAHAVPLSPGGVGVFQFAAMLPLTGAYGVDAGAALAFGVLLQLSETAVSVCLGLVFLIRENLAQASTGAGAGAPSRLIALRNAIRSSSVLRASRAGRM
jgi:hypothetical protein